MMISVEKQRRSTTTKKINLDHLTFAFASGALTCINQMRKSIFKRELHEKRKNFRLDFHLKSSMRNDDFLFTDKITLILIKFDEFVKKISTPTIHHRCVLKTHWQSQFYYTPSSLYSQKFQIYIMKTENNTSLTPPME